MIDAAIAIRIGSPYSTLSLVRQTIESIEKNFGNGTYRFILSPDPAISSDIKEYLVYRKHSSPNKFILQKEKTVYWSEFINQAIEEAHYSRYFIISHDDILVHSPNFFERMVKALDKKEEKIGWIAFDDISYKHRFWSPPTRTGYFIDSLYEDAWKKRTLFQFHNLPTNWWEPSIIRWFPRPVITSLRLGLPVAWKQQLFEQPLSQDMLRLLDIPNHPVKCHACWNNFVVIKTKVLEDLGMCDHWQTYNALLVDEDWGLRAMKKCIGTFGFRPLSSSIFTPI